MSFAPGTAIGDYEVLGTLGAGGQGAVYRVRHVISQREEALKILLPDIHDNTDLGDRFMREIQVLARLNHPNIAALHTALRIDNQLLMVMELVEGVSLRQRMRSPGVRPTEAIGCTLQVLGALEYAHQAGVVHRDIKPSNIMIANHGIVKLLDFGIATGSGARRLTKTGAAIGSIHYMSPEQIRGGPIDARSDLYSTAVTLWQMTAGKCPFEGEGEYEVMMGHLEAEPVPPRNVAGVPGTLWEILCIALAKSPSRRFQSAAEFRTALQTTRLGAIADPAMDTPTEALPRYTAAVSPVSPSSTIVGSSKPSHTSNPSILDEITKELALFVGPIAKVLVKRRAAKARDLDELYGSLAEEITSTRDREKFLAARPRNRG